MFFEGPMATPIRPGFQTDIPQATQRPDVARNAAQRAFFQAAMGNAAAPAAPQAPVQAPVQAQARTQVTAPTAQAQPIHRMPTSFPAEPPTKILRPGSLLDIKV
jgi:uncharacterized membrane protein